MEVISDDCLGRKAPGLRDASVKKPGSFLLESPSSFGLPGHNSTVLTLAFPPSLLLYQGLQDECQYLLQPQLIVRRLLDVAVLVPGRPSEQTLSAHNRSALYK